MNKDRFIFGWTELIQGSYEKTLVGGGTYHGIRTVGAINHYSDGTSEPVNNSTNPIKSEESGNN